MIQALLLHRIVYVCTGLIFVAGLGSLDHLTWKETLRLLLILSGLILLYVRYRRQALDRACNSETQPGSTQAGGVIVALAAAFAITQFDPATSAISYRIAQPRFNAFFLVTTLFSVVMGGAFLAARWRSLRVRKLQVLDQVVVGVVGFSVVVSLGAKQFLGAGIAGMDVLVVVKVMSYLLIWFPVTRVYSEPVPGGDGVRVGWMGHFLRYRWAGTLGMLCLLFVPALISGVARTAAVVSHYGEARKLLASKALEAAHSQFEIAQQLNVTVDLGPVRSGILEDLALLYLAQGNDQAAKQAIGQLRGTTYDQAEADRKTADVYVQAGKWAEAASAYTLYLEKAGKNKEVLDRLGEAYLHLQDSRGLLRIIEEFKYVPKIDAQTYEQQIFVGNVQFYRENFTAALSYFEAAATLRPEDSYAMYKIGRTYLSQMKYEAAVEKFQKVVELEPDFADAYYRLAGCYESLGRKGEALHTYEKTIALLPNHLDGLLAVKRLQEKH